MKSGITLLASAVLLLAALSAIAEQSVVPAKKSVDTAPWRVAKVAKLNRARGGTETPASVAAPQKYLSIQVDFKVPAAKKANHKFRITDRKGKEVGELWGWNKSRSLVIFDGNWGSLAGLYLESSGHREPLFNTGTNLPVASNARPVVGHTGTTVDDRTGIVVGGPSVIHDPDVVVDENPRVVVHDRGPDSVVYHGTDRVVVHDGTYDHDRVIVHHDGPRVAHVGGGSVTHIHEGGDRTVTHIHEGGDSTVTHIHKGAGSGAGSGASSGEGSGEGSGECPPGEGSPGDALASAQGEGSGEGSGECPPGEGAPGDALASAQGKGGPGECSTACPCGPGCCCPASKGLGGACICPCEGSPGKGGPGKGGPGTGGPGDCEPGERGLDGPGGPGERGQPGYGQMASSGGIKGFEPETIAPAFVLYVLAGEETGPGKLYQVNEHGDVLGVVSLPHTGTGVDLHRSHGLVMAVPRDGGKIMRVDDTGKLSTLLEKDKTLVHPIDVAVGGDSDTVLVADNIADVMATTTSGGARPKVYQRLEGQKWTAQEMSIAVTKDKHVILGTDGDKGIYRMSGRDTSTAGDPLLPGPGGVAADPKSLRWAATQDSDQIYVFEGPELEKKLRLPPKKSHYRNGLLSFSPAGSVCVAVRDSDTATGEVWLLMYDIEKDEIRNLFPWKREPMTDFVVGPRMIWERNSPNTYKSTY